MQLYFTENLKEGAFELSTEVSHHLSKVLRKQSGDAIQVTNGKGAHAICTISAIDKKGVTVIANEIVKTTNHNKVALAISFTKNANRIEWLLEKATEIGVTDIYPLNTKRTDNIYPKKERLQNIIASAMCQSKQYYLPILHSVTTLQALANISTTTYIAHCIDTIETQPLNNYIHAPNSSLIIIGPEGDFTEDEVHLAIANGCKSVSLGVNRLRTETAALKALSILNN